MALFRPGWLGFEPRFLQRRNPGEHRKRHAGAISRALQLALFLVGQQDPNNFFSLLTVMPCSTLSIPYIIVR
jgi:hypothetical protein